MARQEIDAVFGCSFYEEVDANFRCQICYGVMLKPVSLPCGHSGCKACFEQTIQLTSGAEAKCPFCRAKMPDNLSVNVCLDHITGKLPMHCASAGCEWRGTLGGAEEHERGCAKKVISCNSEGCDHSAPREEMAEHGRSCPKRKATCGACGKVLTAESLPRHEEETCPFVLKDCPLECGERLPRCNIHLHLHCCQAKAVRCEIHGCKGIYRRGDREEHLTEAGRSHQVMQGAEIQRLRRLIAEKRTDQETCGREEAHIYSFKWDIPQFKDVIERHRTLASDIFSTNGRRWRGIISSAQEISVELVSAVNAVTTEIRIVLEPNCEQETTHELPPSTLMEGDTLGRRRVNLDAHVGEDGSLCVKFVIIELIHI